MPSTHVIVTLRPSVMVSYPDPKRTKKYASGAEVPFQKNIKSTNHLLVVSDDIKKKLAIKALDVNIAPNSNYFEGAAFLRAYEDAVKTGDTKAKVNSVLRRMCDIDKNSSDASLHKQGQLDSQTYAIEFIARLKTALANLWTEDKDIKSAKVA